jgi:hypothetical protein
VQESEADDDDAEASDAASNSQPSGQSTTSDEAP